MAKFMRLVVAVLAFMPLGLMAQNPAGVWKITLPDGNGGTMPLKVTMADNGTFALDYGADGTTETKGKYSVENGKMKIQETEGTECSSEGVYTIKLEGNTLTMTRVSDGCPNRGGPQGIMVFQKE